MSKIRFMSLGGLGENGKNMYIVEVDSKIFILDAGMKYPEVDMFGVDGVIPDIDYLIKNKQNIEGIFISHGHEDHIGAIPYLLKHLQTRVYGTHFTISLIESILTDNHMDIKEFKLFRINASKVMKFGSVDVTFFNTTHSIPESIGICLSTKDGAIVYCTDFNFNAFKSGTYQTTYDKIIDITRNNTKVLALLSESLNAGTKNRITNDSLLEHNFNNILMLYPGRIFVGAYSTDLVRIQKIIDLAALQNRKIAIYSPKNERIIDVAKSSNYLRIPEELKFDLADYSIEELNNLTDVVIIITGFRHEPYSTLVKIAVEEHELLHFKENDKIIIMCPPIPGTEKYTTKAINTLYEYNANLSIFDKDVLRSAHASPDDLRTLYAMLKPNYIIPIKGEYRHMYEQFLVANDFGYEKDKVLLLDNGDVATFDNGVLTPDLEKISVGDIFIDGTSIGVVDDEVIRERNTLAEEGIVFLYASVDLRQRTLVGNISIDSRGFTHGMTEEELSASLGGLMERIVNNALTKKTWNLDNVKESLKEELSKLIVRYTKHRPIVVPIILEIK